MSHHLSKDILRILLSNPFNNYQDFIHLNSHFIPKPFYPFTSAFFDSKEYDNIESNIPPTAIAKMGLNRTWPLALRYESNLFGRLDLEN